MCMQSDPYLLQDNYSVMCFGEWNQNGTRLPSTMHVYDPPVLSIPLPHHTHRHHTHCLAAWALKSYRVNSTQLEEVFQFDWSRPLLPRLPMASTEPQLYLCMALVVKAWSESGQIFPATAARAQPNWMLLILSTITPYVLHTMTFCFLLHRFGTGRLSVACMGGCGVLCGIEYPLRLIVAIPTYIQTMPA